MNSIRVLAVLSLSTLAGCAATPKAPPTPPPAAAALPASYDWRVLVTAPFGSTLKDIPFKLHEVLLFGEEENAPATRLECYGIDQEAPLFLARSPDEYLLCFRHDRLAHIEAVVNVPKSDAQQILGDACGLWQKNAVAPAVPGADAAAAKAARGGDCLGVDGTVNFKASLDDEVADADRALTVKLDVAQP